MFTPYLDTPWKLTNQIYLWLISPIVWLNFVANGLSWGKNWRFYGKPIILKHKHSQMSFGSGLQLRSTVKANPLGANRPVILCTWQPGSNLIIGSDFGMTGGTICAAKSITIGDRVTIGANTTIIDTDFHPIDPFVRRNDSSNADTAPITIEDDVFIGMNCLILKGVRIGKGSVVGAGSVVTKNVSPYSIVGGNPAKFINFIPERSE